MNRVQINEKDVDLIFDFDCTSMVICGWKGGFRNLHEQGIFDIIVKF